MPAELIVPVAALPPATPFTSQVTAVFEEPLTVAAKDCAMPIRTLAVFGETETVIAGGGLPPLLPEPPEEPLVTPAQRAWKSAAATTRMSEKRRMAIGTTDT